MRPSGGSVLIDTEKLVEDLNRLHEQWLRDSTSPFFADKRDWVKGVLHGIKLALHSLHQRE